MKFTVTFLDGTSRPYEAASQDEARQAASDYTAHVVSVVPEGFEDAASIAWSIRTDLAMIDAAIGAGQPAPALAGGIMDAAGRLLEAMRRAKPVMLDPK